METLSNTNTETLNKPITIDMIIEKFIPVIGALFMVVGLGYLLYTSVWQGLDVTVRLGLGFFCSVILIGGGYSATDKLKYLADVIIGAGVVLLYGTLMYGSRTTDLSQAAIPEIATLVTAVIFMACVTYFAAERRSKVIFALSMIAAYITPFVIGGEFGTSVLSFNSYLIYFACISIVGTILGRDFSVRELQPLNIVGLFFGTTSLYIMAFDTIQTTGTDVWNSPEVSVFLFGILTLGTIYSIISSSRHYTDTEDVYISFAYILPLAWLFLSIQALPLVSMPVMVVVYALTALGYYAGWWYLRDASKKYQHMGLYTGAIVALCLAVFSFFPQNDVYVWILVAYLGLLFAYLYTWDSKRIERLWAYMVLSILGAIMTLDAVYFASIALSSPTMLALVGLAPAALGYFIQMLAKGDEKSQGVRDFMAAQSVIFGTIFVAILAINLITEVPFTLAFMTLPAFALSIYALVARENPRRGDIMRWAMILLFLGFIGDFLFYVERIVPHAADMDRFIREGVSVWNSPRFIETVFALLAMFLSLRVSRQIQETTKEYRPSFLLVIFAYSTLVLAVNYLIILTFNQMGTSTTELGGPRAVATTLWWVAVSCTMLVIWVQKGYLYRSEKLLGLLFLAITIAKVLFYDLSTMGTDKKIIVLMFVGGLLLAVSYFFQTKNLLARDPSEVKGI